MATHTLTIRRKAPTREALGSSFAGALALHLGIAGSILSWSLLPGHRQEIWGEHAAQAGSVQATMVDALPLPPHQRVLDNAVLTSDAPSPAPAPPTPAAEAAARKDEVLIPNKVEAKTKTADTTTPPPPKHAQPAPQTDKAKTGETAGVQIAQSSVQTVNGTASVSVEEKSFGERYAYYVNAVTRKITENWYAQEADPRTSSGRTVSVTFTINRDGSVSNIGLASKSGSPTLDSSATRALQRIESFGPLPQGDHVQVQYTFIYRQP